MNINKYLVEGKINKADVMHIAKEYDSDIKQAEDNVIKKITSYVEKNFEYFQNNPEAVEDLKDNIFDLFKRSISDYLNDKLIDDLLGL